MDEILYSKGGIVVHYNSECEEAYTTDRGKLPIEHDPGTFTFSDLDRWIGLDSTAAL